MEYVGVEYNSDGEIIYAEVYDDEGNLMHYIIDGYKCSDPEDI